VRLATSRPKRSFHGRFYRFGVESRCCITQITFRHDVVAVQHRARKENSKSEVARVVPFERGSRLEEALRRRAFLGPDAYVFGNAKTGEYAGTFRSAWETLLLLSHDVQPAARLRGHRRCEREGPRKINLHWHDLRHEALSRLADEGVPVHELQMLAGHASITTTQRYMNARANALAESMRQARQRRANRLTDKGESDHEQVS